MSGQSSVDPAEALAAGFTIQVVRLAGEPKQARGTILETGPERVVVRCEPPVSFQPGERAILLAHLAAGRYAGNAFVAEVAPDRLVFTTEDRWDALDLRNHPRYYVSLAVRVLPPGGRKVSGLMADVSLGGARVTVTEPVAADALLLEVEDAGFGAWLPCRVVGTDESGGTRTLHLEFVDLTLSQFAFVRNVVSRAREVSGGRGRLAA